MAHDQNFQTVGHGYMVPAKLHITPTHKQLGRAARAVQETAGTPNVAAAGPQRLNTPVADAAHRTITANAGIDDGL